MLTMWYQTKCANCGAENFIDNGDPSDMTVESETGFICWSCFANNLITEAGAELTDEEQYADGEHFEKVT